MKRKDFFRIRQVLFGILRVSGRQRTDALAIEGESVPWI